MLYLATIFWLLVIVLTAASIHSLWSSLMKPRLVNSLLLPGTLIAQLGHVLGLLVTGATVSDTTLIKDDDSGAPETTKNAKPRIPVLGPVVIGMLPLVACAIAIYFLAHRLGGSLFSGMTETTVVTSLPRNLTGVWQLLRGLIDLLETYVDACARSNIRDWRVWLFVYLLVCLTVRMAPFPGTLRGSLGAIVMLGILLFVSGLTLPRTEDFIQEAWPVLSLAVATLLVLLLISLIATGLVHLFKLLSANR